MQSFDVADEIADALLDYAVVVFVERLEQRAPDRHVRGTMWTRAVPELKRGGDLI